MVREPSASTSCAICSASLFARSVLAADTARMMQLGSRMYCVHGVQGRCPRVACRAGKDLCMTQQPPCIAERTHVQQEGKQHRTCSTTSLIRCSMLLGWSPTGTLVMPGRSISVIVLQ
jgi:hypothetical protein